MHDCTYMHVQLHVYTTFLNLRWTGSNTNPNNNDGQGRAGTDRSNIVLLRGPNYDEGNGMATRGSPAIGHWGNSYPAHLDDDIIFLGLSREDRQSVATLDNSKDAVIVNTVVNSNP